MHADVPRFSNPPIVEAWISLEFQGKPDKEGWLDDARVFRQTYSKDFPRANFVVTREVEVAEKTDGSMPVITKEKTVVDLVRMQTEDETQVLQLGDDKMAFNLLTGGADYPGFNFLLDETFRHLATYKQIYQPAGIRRATIHYTDIVNIPTGGQPIQISDFFSVARDIPAEPFGDSVYLAYQFVTKAPHDGEPMQFGLGLIPTDRAGELRFRLDWEKSCESLEFGDESAFRSGLSTNHEFLVDCFLACVTPRTQEFFGRHTTED